MVGHLVNFSSPGQMSTWTNSPPITICPDNRVGTNVGALLNTPSSQSIEIITMIRNNVDIDICKENGVFIEKPCKPRPTETKSGTNQQLIFLLLFFSRKQLLNSREISMNHKAWLNSV